MGEQHGDLGLDPAHGGILDLGAALTRMPGSGMGEQLHGLSGDGLPTFQPPIGPSATMISRWISTACS